MIRKFLLILTLGLAFLLQNSILAEGFTFRKYAGEFMEIGVAARAQAMGGASTSLSGDIAATYYNPAGLYNIEGMQLSFMHTQQFLSSINYDYLAFAKRQGKNRVLALSLVRLGVENIKDSRQAQQIINSNGDWNIDFSRVKEFDASDYLFTLSVAQHWRGGWILGGNIKLIRRNLAENHANGLGFDLAMMRNISDRLTVAANLRNATSTLIAWDTGEKELVSPSLFLGAGYLLNLSFLKSSLRPTADLIFRTENRRETARANLGGLSMDVAAGAELLYRNLLALRSGVDEIGRFNAGVGILIPHIRVDYAFTSYDSELQNSHRIGIVISL
ncbi:MAG: PorV/PorQ family protein [Calditrichia bacterium]